MFAFLRPRVSRVSSFPAASPCLCGKLQNLSFSRVFKQVVMSICVAGVAFCDIPTCFIPCRKSFCVAGAILSRHFHRMSCSFHGRSIILEISVVILRGKGSTSDVSHCVPHFALHTLHFTLHTLHFTFHSLHFTLHIPHSTLYTPHPALYTLHSTLCTLHSAFHTLHSTLYTLLSTLYTLQPALHTLHFTLLTPQFTLHAPHFSLHTLHSTLCTLHSTLHTPLIHLTLYIPQLSL